MTALISQPHLPGIDLVERPKTPMDLLQLAIEREGSIDVIERLARLQMEMLDRDAKLAYGQAFEQFKANAPRIVKDSVILVNEQPRGKFAKLDKICDQLIPALLAVGITHRWSSDMSPDGNKVIVTCYLKHRLGYEEKGSTLGAGPDTSGSKNALQAVGSTASYLERYTLVMSCGISIKDQDTDGNTQKVNPGDLLEGSVIDEFVSTIEESTTPDELKQKYQAAVKAGASDPSALRAFDKAKKETWKKRGFRA